MLRSIVFTNLVASKSDAEFLEFLDEMYLCRDNLRAFVSDRERNKSPNDLLKEIFFITETLKTRLENGETFTDISRDSQIAFYKHKAGKNES
ncbi:hypothetical protein N9948_00370 [bacterium]|nr:hypothetical protein [bacterium]